MNQTKKEIPQVKILEVRIRRKRGSKVRRLYLWGRVSHKEKEFKRSISLMWVELT